MERHQPIRFGCRDTCSLLLQAAYGLDFVFHIYNFLCCFCIPTCGSRRGGMLSRNRRLLRTYRKASKSIAKETDVAALIKKVRQHDVALKASILCDKKRLNLIEHARDMMLNIDTTDSNEYKTINPFDIKDVVGQEQGEISEDPENKVAVSIVHGLNKEQRNLINANLE